MSLSNFLLTLKGGPGSGNKGHAGRPGKRGGSSSKTKIINPTSLDEIGKIVKKNIETMDDALYKEIGYGNTRIPAILDPKTGEIIVHGTPGTHNSMVYMGKDDTWQDNYVRFGLVLDKEFKKVTEVQFSSAFTGINQNDRNFENSSMKRIYQTMDKLGKIEGIKGSKAIIEHGPVIIKTEI